MLAIKKLVEKSLAAEYRLLHDADHSFKILVGRYTDSSEYENSWTGRIAGAYRLHNNVKAHASFGSAIQKPYNHGILRLQRALYRQPRIYNLRKV